MPEDEPKGFRIVDRRGAPEPEAPAGQPAPGPPTPPGPARDPGTEESGLPGAGGAAGGGTPGVGDAAAPGHGRDRGGPPTFLDLVGMLQFGALASLGMIQGPDGTRTPVDLEAAKESIDMLGMLQEKTKGNLAPDETEVLTEGLYHIRMAYVALVNAAAGPGGKKT